MANPMYGQNKFDNKVDVKGALTKSGGIPVQDQYGIAPLGGSIIPPFNGADSYGDLYGVSATGGGITLADADPYTESATQLFPLGSTLNLGDRVFKYAQMNGAVTAGKVLQQAANIIANHSQMTATAVVAVSTGDTVEISVETQGDTDITANQYQEGYLFVNDADGEGQSWKIKSHPAHDHSADASIVITCYGKVSTALATASELCLTTNPYKDVIIAPTAETGMVVGVTNIDMTDDYFGWLQVRGPKALLASGTIVLGQQVSRSGGTAGACLVQGDDVLFTIGQSMASTVVSGEYALIDLCIA
jgi:hypothetical protein